MASKGRIDCKKCMMSFTEKYINALGECVLCNEHRKKWFNKDYAKSEKELLEIFDHYKKRNKNRKYDSIVAFTGGKDSSYALYLAVKKFGLRPLAVTSDNGLLAPIAIKNMKRIVDLLGVDHLIVTRDKEELRSIYRAFFRKTKTFCEVCYLTILSSLGQAAVDYDVPLIITGAAFKVDSSHFRAEARYCVEDAVINIVKDSIPIDIYSKYMSKHIRANRSIHLLHIFDYVNYIEREIYRVLENELGWDSMKREDKHADCKFHHMLGYLRFLNNDSTSLVFMTPAALLRDGQITVEQFREMLAKEKTQFQHVNRNEIDEFLDFFGIEEAFLTTDLESPKFVEPLVSEKDFDVLRKYRNRSGIRKRDLIEMLFGIIRPELERDGGDIKILEYKDKVLRIEFLGGCRACYMADTVMMRYLEHLVRTHISEDIIIENVRRLVPIS
jgi:Fe-S cluster biogenesis protein NfuA